MFAFHQTREGGVVDETYLYMIPAIGPGAEHVAMDIAVGLENPTQMPLIGGTYVDRDGNPPERITYGYQGVRPKYRPTQPPPADPVTPPAA